MGNRYELSAAQRNTLSQIIEDTKKGGWRYEQPPATRYPKRTLTCLCNRGLIKFVHSPMYSTSNNEVAFGVSVTDKGNSIFEQDSDFSKKKENQSNFIKDWYEAIEKM